MGPQPFDRSIRLATGALGAANQQHGLSIGAVSVYALRLLLRAGLLGLLPRRPRPPLRPGHLRPTLLEHPGLVLPSAVRPQHRLRLRLGLGRVLLLPLHR